MENHPHELYLLREKEEPLAIIHVREIVCAHVAYLEQDKGLLVQIW